MSVYSCRVLPDSIYLEIHKFCLFKVIFLEMDSGLVDVLPLCFPSSIWKMSVTLLFSIIFYVNLHSYIHLFLYVMYYFSLAVFKIFLLFLIFGSLIMMSIVLFYFAFICVILGDSWICKLVSFKKVGILLAIL